MQKRSAIIMYTIMIFIGQQLMGIKKNENKKKRKMYSDISTLDFKQLDYRTQSRIRTREHHNAAPLWVPTSPLIYIRIILRIIILLFI